jgi:formylmethanofuran dehydrogenase subunit A
VLRITNGEVYDPRNGINGQKLDIWVEGGKVVAVGGNPSQQPPEEVIDASGAIIMPGGVDIHAHIAGGKVNLGRKMRPEDHRGDIVPRTEMTRSGVGYSVPSTFVTGYRYAGMGYTTVMEAAVPPLAARHTHGELADMPIIDKGCYPLMGANHFVLKCIERKEAEKLKAFVSWLLKATKGYAIKIVNPCGVESWKWGKDVESIDDQAADYAVTPRQLLLSMAKAHEELGLPHSIHVHCNNLGTPGNYKTTLETMKAVEGRKIHITHTQFNSYGGTNWGDFCSKAPEIAEYINEHKNVTLDVGQVVFGDTTTMTADGPWQYRLYKLSGNKWANTDIEMETGTGVVPYTFKKGSLVNAVQWAIGLELLLLIKDPWRVFLTTDHPNAGPFMFYPQVIKLLMNKDFREEKLAELPKRVREKTLLAEINREYSLYEIAIITRAGTAKALGLTNKGHLGIGADADIAIYSKDDVERMFSSALYVLKAGEVVVKNGKVVKDCYGKTFYVDPPQEDWIEHEIREDFDKFYTVSFQNYPVQMKYLPKSEVVPCK